MAKNKETNELATEENTPAGEVIMHTHGNIFQRFSRWYGRHKKWTLPITALLFMGLLAAVPYTRYALAGTVLKQKFTIRVLDSETNKPVSSATVVLDGVKAQTNSEGRAEFKVSVGDAELSVEKNYYQKAGQKTLVPILKQKQQLEIKIKATGRQVPITVVNKITKKPLENATVTALDTKANTDKEGKAVLVLPADKQNVDAVIAAENYNELKQAVVVTAEDKKNEISMTPAGSIYFLSDRSGTLDVVKSDLDGGNRKVVLAGTGKEEKRSTVLLASRDWKYLTLLSKRNGNGRTDLFTIDTSTDKLTQMMAGAAEYNLVGWSGHKLIYIVTFQNVQTWQPKRQALSSLDADTGKVTTLDQTTAEGDASYHAFNQIDAAYILKDELVYTKSWQARSAQTQTWSQSWLQFRDNVRAKKAEIRTIKPDGSAGRTVKEYTVPVDHSNAAQPVSVQLYSRQYEPQGVWLYPSGVASEVIEEYEGGQIKAVQDVKPDQFWEKEYQTRLISPDGTKTFWSEARDGKNTLLIGNVEGKEGQEIAKLSEYASYGWFTDQYVLVSQKGSELYIMPIVGGEALKLTDYYKPYVDFSGYGYGYGGL